MSKYYNFREVPIVLLLLLWVSSHAAAGVEEDSIDPHDQRLLPCPSNIYCHGILLRSAQMYNLYPDSKTFVDLHMKASADETWANFTKARGFWTEEKVRDFVDSHFDGPGSEFEDWSPADWVPRPKFVEDIANEGLQNFALRVHELWKVLGRKIKDDVSTLQDHYSLLHLPHPFIVPGGRFRELYYWDTYWVAEGMILSEMTTTLKGMLKNMLYLVDMLGHVPNGNRIYYRRRSQPPMFIPMVNMYVENTGDVDFLREAIDTLEKEFSFWENNRTVAINGTDGQQYRLSRYAVDMNGPRPESYREDKDVALRKKTTDEAALTYAHIASAAESGWDFSSRWMAPGRNQDYTLDTLVTRSVIPVDLNAILAWNARLLSQFHEKLGNEEASRLYASKAAERQEAVETVLWNSERGVWQDVSLTTGKHIDRFYPSHISPIWTGSYGGGDRNKTEIEQQVFQYFMNQKYNCTSVLKLPGGVPTSLLETGEQWDFPNAWPPAQDMVISSLEKMSSPEARALAQDIAGRWINTSYRMWRKTGSMFEKYNAKTGDYGHGGEYDVQIGFGWTNGLVLKLLNKYGNQINSTVHLASYKVVSSTSVTGRAAFIMSALAGLTSSALAYVLAKLLFF